MEVVANPYKIEETDNKIENTPVSPIPKKEIRSESPK